MKSKQKNFTCVFLLTDNSFGIAVSWHDTSYLVGVLCKSVGVLLAEVHAGGAGALSQAPAEEAATSLTGADCGRLNDGDLTWLPGREPGKGKRPIEQN